MALTKNQKLKVLRRLEKINRELDEDEMLDGLENIFKSIVRSIKEDDAPKVFVPKFYYDLYFLDNQPLTRKDITFVKHENIERFDSNRIKDWGNCYLTAKEARAACASVWEILCK